MKSTEITKVRRIMNCVTRVSALSLGLVLFQINPSFAEVTSSTDLDSSLNLSQLQAGEVIVNSDVLEFEDISNQAWRDLSQRASLGITLRDKQLLLFQAAFISNRPAEQFNSSTFILIQNLEALLGAKILKAPDAGGNMTARAVITAPILKTQIPVEFNLKMDHYESSKLNKAGDKAAQSLSGLAKKLTQLSDQSDPVISHLIEEKFDSFSAFFERSQGIVEFIKISEKQTLVVLTQASVIKPTAWKKLQMITFGFGESALIGHVEEQVSQTARAFRFLK